MFIFFFFCTGYTLFQNRGAAPLEDTLTTAYRKEIVLSIPGQAVNLHVSIVRMQGVRPSCFHCPDAGSTGAQVLKKSCICRISVQK